MKLTSALILLGAMIAAFGAITEIVQQDWTYGALYSLGAVLLLAAFLQEIRRNRRQSKMDNDAPSA
jgi:hypothetical protein